MSWWLGIGTGIGVIGAYGALRALTHRLARGRPNVRSFLVVELAGLGGRVVLVLIAVGGVLLFLPVHPGAFVGTVCGLLVVCIAIEVSLLARRRD